MPLKARGLRAICLLPLLLLGTLAGCEKPEETAPESIAVLAPSAADDHNEVGVAPPVAAMSTSARSEYEQNTIDVFKALAPSVVFVTNKQMRRNQWTRRDSEVKAGAGTGFIWDRRGHIVTNFHVVNKGTAFDVTMYDGTVLPAKFVGGDPLKDIAVLKIVPPRGIRPVTLPALKSVVEPGQKAIAIGNPFGFDHTLTVGVISAIGREMPGFGGVTIRDMLQTDASINPGNSGGPLLDSEGHLIGMNTMISGSTGNSSGVGFAVPVSAIRRAVPDIIKYGRVKRAGLGVTLYPDKSARANGIVGVVIDKVTRGTPAAKAGLRGLRSRRGQVLLGDVIVGINAYKVTNYDQLYNALDRFGVGDAVNVTILRGTKRTTVSLKLMQLE